ncbi:unnamed protein product [Mucor circinelloides]
MNINRKLLPEQFYYSDNRKLLPEHFYSPNNTFCLHIQQTCVSALRRRCYNISAGSSTREDEGVRVSIEDAYRHHLWR